MDSNYNSVSSGGRSDRQRHDHCPLRGEGVRVRAGVGPPRHAAPPLPLARPHGERAPATPLAGVPLPGTATYPIRGMKSLRHFYLRQRSHDV